MTTLTVWKFPTADGAERAEDTLKQLHKQGLAQLIETHLTHEQEDNLREVFAA